MFQQFAFLILNNVEVNMKFFENPSVSAFIGALSAFLLVLLIDWIRKLKRVRIIPQLVKMNIDIVSQKIDAVKNCQNTISKRREFLPTPLMKFSTKDIKKIESEVLDQLKPELKLSLDSICYFLDEIDSMLDDAVKKIYEHQRIKAEKGDKYPLLRELEKQVTNDYNDSISNMKRVIDMSNLFLEKKYDEILNKKYKKEDFNLM